MFTLAWNKHSALSFDFYLIASFLLWIKLHHFIWFISFTNSQVSFVFTDGSISFDSTISFHFIYKYWLAFRVSVSSKWCLQNLYYFCHFIQLYIIVFLDITKLLILFEFTVLFLSSLTPLNIYYYGYDYSFKIGEVQLVNYNWRVFL